MPSAKRAAAEMLSHFMVPQRERHLLRVEKTARSFGKDEETSVMMGGQERTSVMNNALVHLVMAWRRTQAETFYGESIQKLVLRHDKYLNLRGDYVEKYRE